MKQLVSVPVYGLIFWRATSLKHFTGQHGRYFSAFRAARPEVLSTVLNSKDQKNAHIQKRFSSSQDPAVLTDFDVWPHPKFSYLPRLAYYHALLCYMESFSVLEFTKCSEKALHVVATLLSELRFPELEGLLTPECKAQVSKNMESWTKSQASFLLFNPEHLTFCLPSDIYVASDERGKTYAEVRVIYHVLLEFSEMIGNRQYAIHPEQLNIKCNNKLYMHAAYNCLFIKELTEGITDQWTIDRINVKSLPYGFIPYKFINS